MANDLKVQNIYISILFNHKCWASVIFALRVFIKGDVGKVRCGLRRLALGPLAKRRMHMVLIYLP